MLGLRLDQSAQLKHGGQTLMGGDPPRAIRLSAVGARVLAELLASRGVATADADLVNERKREHEPANTTAARSLARRITDAGLAHPVPVWRSSAGGADEVTVVIPVRDRPDGLNRCLAAVRGQADRAGHASNAEDPASDGAWRSARTRPIIVVDDGSSDAHSVSAICERHGAQLVRRDVAGGPGEARNAALPFVRTPLVAFLDSDCLATPDWIDQLAGHFADPLVAAVAPRVKGEVCSTAGAVARFAASRSPLDMGLGPARVVPGGHVSYVPTAALLVRAASLGDGFDPDLRYGEDVDLIWRLHDAGWRIRYDPGVIVRHSEPGRWRALAARRYRHGTSAGPLAVRHRKRLAPLVLAPRQAATVALTLLGQRRLAIVIAATHTFDSARRLRPAGVGARDAAKWQARGTVRTALTASRAIATLTPGLLLLAGVPRRARMRVSILSAVPPLCEWSKRRPPLDPLRWTALALADDVAYGAGVWVGSLRAGTWGALRPVLTHSSEPNPENPGPSPRGLRGREATRGGTE